MLTLRARLALRVTVLYLATVSYAFCLAPCCSSVYIPCYYRGCVGATLRYVAFFDVMGGISTDMIQ